MASAMLADRGLRRKITEENPQKPAKKPTKRKSSAKSPPKGEQNNNIKRQRLSADGKEEMLANYQPWVIQTYGDLAKTKTITIKKYARILRTLRGEEVVSADNSKFRFWVKAKGFYVGKPPGYDAKPADAIVGRYSVCDADEGIPAVNEKLSGSAKDPPLYVPNAPFKNSTGEPVYRKVAVVENFFDIIYNVHVELEGRPGKHAGQKRTYRTITETYAFLPREAVTRFLLGCTECQKHPRSPSPPVSVLPTPSPSPTLPTPSAAPLQPPTTDAPSPPQPPAENHPCETPPEQRRSNNPLDVCNLTAKDPPKPPATPPKKRHLHTPPQGHVPPKLWSPVEGIEKERLEQQKNLLNPQNIDQNQLNPHQNQANHQHNQLNLQPDQLNHQPNHHNHQDLHHHQLLQTPKRRILMAGDIDYSLPITTTYLKYMRSLGCSDEDALKLESKNENLATTEPSEVNEEDHFPGSGAMKDSDKLKLMLLAWNYHNQAQGNRNGNTGDIPDLSSVPGGEEMAGLWAQYHSALGLAKGKSTPPTTRDQSSPINADASSAQDETSSSGNKEDEDDDDDESDDKIDAQTHDPERLKAFNMFVRLFVDENLDRMVPISKQPKEKIQAIIDSCTRQFPEFAERARKRIRTYLKSCRRNKRARDPNSPWDATRPTPAHLTSVQAEQILATACENESHNAKRMRLGLEPVSQPMPLLPGAPPTDTTAPINRTMDFTGTPQVKLEADAVSSVFPSSTTPSSTPNSSTKGLSLTPDIKTTPLSVSSGLGTTPMNGLGIASTAGSAPTAMYRPNFSQAFQRAGPYPPLFPQSPFGGSTGLLANGPTDLSMKQKPLLNHKLSTGEMAAVRQLITGYRESAAFLLRSADELEQLLLQQQ